MKRKIKVHWKPSRPARVTIAADGSLLRALINTGAFIHIPQGNPPRATGKAIR